MTRFEPWTSGIRSYCSVNCVTTTAQIRQFSITFMGLKKQTFEDLLIALKSGKFKLSLSGPFFRF